MTMNRFYGMVVAMMTLVGIIPGQDKVKDMNAQAGVYSFTMKTIDGVDKPLSNYKGRVMMIVNVASKCGYTPQYEGLEKLYEKYKDKGFVILGFPANNFLWQEPGTDDEIKQFCSTKYNVTFDMFSKINVKGSEIHPLYQYLTKDSPYSGGVKWNFQKYLVDRRGNVVAKYLPGTDPLDSEVIQEIEKLLTQPS
jgi:glutathione peroxidase